MARIKIGSHIITSKTLYTHHGIYIGRKKVIHYSGFSEQLSGGPIELTTLESFSNGLDVIVREYINPKHSSKAAVERAFSRIGEDKYDLHGNNCEHFCTWVITGRSNSRQVERVEDFIDVLIPLNTLVPALKIRKHYKQGFNASDLSKNILDIGVKKMLVTVTPLPLVVGYKALKWLFK